MRAASTQDGQRHFQFAHIALGSSVFQTARVVRAQLARGAGGTVLALKRG